MTFMYHCAISKQTISDTVTERKKLSFANLHVNIEKIIHVPETCNIRIYIQREYVSSILFFFNISKGSATFI